MRVAAGFGFLLGHCFLLLKNLEIICPQPLD
jgi:hypothetical protein